MLHGLLLRRVMNVRGKIRAFILTSCCTIEVKEVLLLSGEGPMRETLDYTIHIGSTPTFLYFDLYL